MSADEISFREFRASDSESLREFWIRSGFRLIYDDDHGLIRFSKRNRGTFLVAEHEGNIVASAMGGWDGRRGWLYHVATHPSYRRKGVGRRLVGLIEDRLSKIGCRKVNLLIVPDNVGARAFWDRQGYLPTPLVEYTKELTGARVASAPTSSTRSTETA